MAKQVMQLMPHENTIYFGDTARVPYGSKSAETVIGYARQATAYLESRNVKLIIVACNTASAVALPHVQSMTSIPVLGVIDPGASAAVEASRSGIIGIIGTEGTIRSEAYQKAVKALLPEATVHPKACPLFVAFAEEGLATHPATILVAHDYLDPMLRQSIDTIIMGCTHYPIVEPGIAQIAGPNITLINPGIATAERARELLQELDLLNDSQTTPQHEHILSDFPHKFIEVGERFLGTKMEHVSRLSIDELTRYHQ